MRRKSLKILLAIVFALITVTVCAVPCFALFTMTGHYDPTGTTSTYYAYDSSECNRTINVPMYDLNGNFLKKVVLKTKHGEDNSFHLALGGYDIVNFSSDQGLWETCKLVWTSGTGLCTEADLFIDYYFRTALSKSTINVRVEMRKWDPISIEARHYVERDPYTKNFFMASYTLHSTDQQSTINYYDYISMKKKSIPGYTLRAEYKSTVSGYFCYESLVGNIKNCPSSPRCHSYSLHQTDWNDDMSRWSSYKESKDGKIDWCDNRKFWVEFYYDITEYTVNYDANGGTGAPEAQTKYYGYDLTLSDTVPTRSGYTFKGWGTYSGDTTVNYSPGGNYTANSSRTLYAIWESNEPQTYTVKYNANGGTGAPASQTKTHGVALKLSSSKPTRSGYTFIGWSTTSGTNQSVRYAAGGSYTANASVTLYAVWNKSNYEFSVSDLTVSDSEPYKYGQITVTVRTDSWDKVNAYSDIPVQLYYDGRLVSTQYVDFTAYGIANLTFTLYVGILKAIAPLRLESIGQTETVKQIQETTA